MFEGFNTYGGMAGRDMNALSVGLHEVTDGHYLGNRIEQVKFLGDKLIDWNIPVQKPIGGHAVFIDATKFLEHVPKEEYIAQTLAVELYLEAGVRGVEVGTLLADRDPETKENRYPRLEMLRLAIPRRTYTNNHMEVVAVALKNIFERRNEITKGLKILSEAPIMRHFSVKLERK
jgi:tryptophanase